MSRCFLCSPPAQLPDDEELLVHLQELHPEEWGEGIETWSDGEPVVVDETLEPEDFRRAPP